MKNRFTITLLLVIAFILLGNTSSAHADDILLGQYENYSGGASSQNIDLTAVVFAVGYDIQGSFSPKPLGICIGCDLPLPPAAVSTGTTYVFNASNTSDFAAFASALTNGTPDTLLSVSAGLPEGIGNGQGNIDSNQFPSSNTWQLDYVTLNVQNFSYGPSSYTTEMKWGFWGTGVPDKSAATGIPEPASLTLLVIGIFALAVITAFKR